MNYDQLVMSLLPYALLFLVALCIITIYFWITERVNKYHVEQRRYHVPEFLMKDNLAIQKVETAKTGGLNVFSLADARKIRALRTENTVATCNSTTQGVKDDDNGPHAA